MWCPHAEGSWEPQGTQLWRDSRSLVMGYKVTASGRTEWLSLGMGKKSVGGGVGCRAPHGTETIKEAQMKEAESWEAAGRGQKQRREREVAVEEGMPAPRSGMGRALSGQWGPQA